MIAGYSGTPLGRKLGVKAGHRVALLGAPPRFDTLLELPDAVILDAEPRVPSSFARTHDVVIVFVRDRPTLKRGLARAHRLLAWNGGLWVAWPKATSPLATDVREGDVREHGLAAGLVDNKVCAVDADWSGLRFVYRLKDRPR